MSQKKSTGGTSSSKRTVPLILGAKAKEQKLVALTSYDYSIASLVDHTGEVDFILVGDSLGSVVQGHQNTLPVTLDEIIYHTKCVVRGTKYALVVADMPFMTYQISPEQALENAGRLIQEGGAQAVKLEGGRAIQETIARIVAVDIPVVGHVGLTPQSYHRMGGHKLQGKSKHSRAHTSADEVLEDALAVEEAGAFCVVLEGIPYELAQRITETLSIPTVGIGAGAECDGQILVINDLLGLNPDFSPRFVKRFRELGLEIRDAVSDYAAEVKGGEFPAEEHTVRDRNSEPAIRLAKK